MAFFVHFGADHRKIYSFGQIRERSEGVQHVVSLQACAETKVLF